LRRLYLLGYPVAHSLSPAMQNAAIKALGLDYEYSLMPVPPAELATRVTELRQPAVAGFNVTIPHKVSVIPLLEALDETASRVGAVNTVVNEGKHLKGYNTDSVASTRVLREAYGSLSGCRAVILGAGGAARAVVAGLAPHAEQITILARDAAKARALADEMMTRAGAELRVARIGDAHATIRHSDILVNATPAGMHPNTDAPPTDAANLHAGLLVFDLIYNPEKTRLLREAEAAGARTVGGLAMLVYQGAEALRLWTGKKAPEALMLEAARAALGGDTT
jgi:shikimate dehydrogenase